MNRSILPCLLLAIAVVGAEATVGVRRSRAQQREAQQAQSGQGFSLESALSAKVSLFSREQPLQTVAEALSRQSGLPIRFHGLNRGVAGVGSKILVNVNVENQSLESALDSLLPAYGLDWTISQDAVVISSRDQIWSQLRVRVYEIGQLAALPSQSADGGDPRIAIAEWIKRSITPQDWGDVGGKASITISGDTLIVKHTNRSQLAVKRMLAGMQRTAAQRQSVPASMSLRMGGDASRRQRLMERTVYLDLRQVNFPTALAALDRLTPLAMRIDQAAIEEEGIDLNEPIDLRCDGITLRAALAQLLFTKRLDYLSQPNRLLITTRETAEQKLLSQTYRVPELIDSADPDKPQSNEDAADSLIELITSVIDPASWEEVGGTATIEATDQGLVIQQRAAVHAELRDFFDACLSVTKLAGDAAAVDLGDASSFRTLQLERSLSRFTGKPLSLKLPLSKFVETIGKQHGVVFLIDRRALDDYGIDADQEMNVEVGNVSLRSLMRMALRPFGLTLMIRDEMIWITTDEEKEARLATKLYPVRDLTTLDGRLPAKFSRIVSDELTQLITASLHPESWDEVGGPGGIMLFEKVQAIAVSQTDDVHRKVAELLGQVRRARAFVLAWDGKGPAPAFPLQMQDQQVEALINKTLSSAAEFQFQQRPLVEVVRELNANHPTPFVIDDAALEDIGLHKKQKATLQARGMSLGAALRHLLRPLSLTATQRDESIVITSMDESETVMETVIYPVPDLVFHDFGMAKTGGEPERDPELDRLLRPDFDTLIVVIQSVLTPDTWDVVGGWGTIEALKPASALVITQTRENHAMVARLLQQMRRDRRRAVQEAAPSYASPAFVGVAKEKALWNLVNSPPPALPARSTTLKSLAHQLSLQLNVAVILDEVGLDDSGTPSSSAVSFSLQAGTLGENLDRALQPLELTWTIRDEAIFITTLEESENHPLQVLYPLRHKLDTALPDYDTLMESITETISPESWDNVGGVGVIESWPQSTALIVSQTPQVHRQVAKRLAR